MRPAIIQDAKGDWYVRKIARSVHDLEEDSMVYHCDQPLAGPFDGVIDAAHWVADNVEDARSCPD